MSQQFELSIVISTYNRCDQLPGALESLMDQTEGASCEVIAVDNNSTDQTRRVIESFIARGGRNLRYVFEGRQGQAHGRNAGIRQARGEIMAFTDDDVRAARDWTANLRRAFDQRPGVGCVGGKILPRWPRRPPDWLTRDHWVGPLALQDYGDEPFSVDAQRPITLAGANLAFRRSALERIGLFSPEFSTYADKSDTELLIRYWRDGGQSLYDPSVVVTAEVQPERLTKEYHRQWHRTAGQFAALMNLDESIDGDGRIVAEPRHSPRLFGAPAFIYRQLATESFNWLKAAISGRESQALTRQHRLNYLIGYIGQSRQRSLAQPRYSRVAEVRSFAAAMWRKAMKGGQAA